MRCFIFFYTLILSSKYHQLFNQIKTFFFFWGTNKDKIKRVDHHDSHKPFLQLIKPDKAKKKISNKTKTPWPNSTWCSSQPLGSETSFHLLSLHTSLSHRYIIHTLETERKQRHCGSVRVAESLAIKKLEFNFGLIWFRWVNFFLFGLG